MKEKKEEAKLKSKQPLMQVKNCLITVGRSLDFIRKFKS